MTYRPWPVDGLRAVRWPAPGAPATGLAARSRNSAALQVGVRSAGTGAANSAPIPLPTVGGSSAHGSAHTRWTRKPAARLANRLSSSPQCLGSCGPVRSEAASATRDTPWRESPIGGPSRRRDASPSAFLRTRPPTTMGSCPSHERTSPLS